MNELADALLRFRVMYYELGYPVDNFSDEEVLDAITAIQTRIRAGQGSRPLAEGVEKLGQDWIILVDAARHR